MSFFIYLKVIRLNKVKYNKTAGIYGTVSTKKSGLRVLSLKYSSATSWKCDLSQVSSLTEPRQLSLVNVGNSAYYVTYMLWELNEQIYIRALWLPWWLSGKESACKAGDAGSIPWPGRSPEEANINPLQ